MSAQVITVASLKGGSGKSTLASCLAVHWRMRGWRVLLVDADPQHSVLRLAAREQALGGLPVIARADRGMWKAVKEQAGDYDLIVVDTPGFDSEITAAGLAVADLVLIPVKPSPLDVDRMTDTVGLLMAGVQGWAPTFRCVLTQTTRGSVIARHIRAELEEAGFPLLRQELQNRVSYAEAALYGATPTLTQPDGAAAQDVQELAGEVEALLATRKVRSA
ncbi:AAA family ATPase [Stappia indica]|uniref:AAA family ATPase n=1 Tax=Stappia indica TaxID=538381 RepID=UPI00082CD267|nr:AAA family ATPase [Stappia indica]